MELKERHFKEWLAKEMEVLHEGQMSELLAVRQGLETANLAGELEGRLSIHSVKAAEYSSGISKFVNEQSQWNI